MALRVFQQAASTCLRNSAARSRSGFRPTSKDLSPIPREFRSIEKRHHSFDNKVTRTQSYNLTCQKRSSSDVLLTSEKSIIKHEHSKKLAEATRKKDKAYKRETKKCRSRQSISRKASKQDKKESKSLSNYEEKEMLDKMKNNKSSKFYSPPPLGCIKGSKLDLEKCNDLIESFKCLNPKVSITSRKNIKLNVPWCSYSDTVSYKPNKLVPGIQSKNHVIDPKKIDVEKIMREWHSGNHTRIDDLLAVRDWNTGKYKENEEKSGNTKNDIPNEATIPAKRMVYTLMTTCRNYQTGSKISMHKTMNVKSDVPTQFYSTEFRALKLPELRRPVIKYNTNVDEPRKNYSRPEKVVKTRADDDKNVHVRKPLPPLKFGTRNKSDCKNMDLPSRRTHF